MKLVPEADMGIEQRGLTVQVPKVQFFAVRHGVSGGKGEEQPLCAVFLGKEIRCLDLKGQNNDLVGSVGKSLARLIRVF